MTEIPDLPPVIFQKLANEISDGLDRFIDSQRWTKRIISTDRTIERRADKTCRNHYHALIPLGRGFRLMFTLAVMDLLTQEAWRPARCARPECNRRFVRDDRRQDYCSERCSKNIRMKRLRSKNKG
jgi:hypothetical protein